MAVLPKNQQTIGLLDRWLAPDSRYTMTEIMLGEYREEEPSAPQPPIEETEEPTGEESREARREERRETQRESTRRELGEDRETSAWFIIGSSLAFEAAILALAAFIFARRDF